MSGVERGAASGGVERAVRRIALIPAAGGGSRFGTPVPKQYARLAGRPMVARTLDRIAGSLALDAIVVALAPDDTWYETHVGLRAGVEVLRCGGPTRAVTVANALTAIAGRFADADWVLVHDAARPCVPTDALRRLVDEIGDDPVGGLLAVPVADTLKREGAGVPARVAVTEPRAGLWQAQTPQMFRLGLLRAALSAPAADAATDEAQAVEAIVGMGRGPRLVPGSPLNLKVTHPADLDLAAAILELQEHAP